MFANADIQSGLSKSDVELGGLDPLPEIRPRRLLQFGGVSALERPERDEVVLVVVGGEALYEGLVGDMVLAPGALAAEALDRQADQRVDDVVLRRPVAALRVHRLLHRRLIGGDSKIGAVSFPLWIVLVAVLVPGDEFPRQRRRLWV